MIRRLPLFAASLLGCFLAPGVFAQSADVSVTLSGPSTVFAQYDIATPSVSISVSSSGPTTVQNLAVDFSPGLSVSLPNFDCETVTNHVRCTTSSFPATTVQGTGSMQVHQPVDGTVVTISATVSSATPDPNAANNTSSVTEVLVWKSYVYLAGISFPTTVPQGVKLAGGVNYEVDGPSYATDVKITFSIPPHATFQGVSPNSPFTCAGPAIGSAGDVVCTAKQVGNSNFGFIGIDLNIDAATPVGTTLTFAATLSSSDAAQPQQPMQLTMTVIAPAEFNTSLVSPASVEPGDTFTNTVTVTNLGPGAAVNTSITFAVSSGGVTAAPVTSPSAPAGWTCSITGISRATCSNSSFAPGTAIFSFPISLSLSAQPAKLTETATARSMSELTGLHDTATATTWISPEKVPDFNLTLTAPPIVHPGGTITYTIGITNTTPNDAYPLLEFVTTPLSGITWTNCPEVAAPGACGLGKFAGGSSRTVYVTTPVVADSNSKMTGLALITGGTFSYLHDARATVISSVEPTPPDMAIALGATPTTLTVGDTVTFTILVTNIGQVEARNVMVDVPLPPSLTLLSSTGHCSNDSGVQCSIGTLAAGAWSTTTITARALEPGAISVTATATMDSSDPQASNNSATVPINVSAALVRRRAVHH